MKSVLMITLDLFLVLLLHVLKVVILGGLAMFVWNIGAVSLLPDLHEIEFIIALAVMTGIYVVDLWIKSYINKTIALKQQKNINAFFENQFKDFDGGR